MKIRVGSLVSAALLSVFCSALIAQEDKSRDTLSYHSKMYQAYEHKEFDLGGEPSRFAWRETPGLFPHTTVNHNKTRILSTKLRPQIADWAVTQEGETMRFDDYVSKDDRIDSVMVLHKGQIVYQRYKTHGPLDRHLTWSVTKVVTSTALARLVEMGKVNMQDPVKKYLPDFSQTAWANISLQNVIDMASGIDCRDSDGYQNTDACVYQAEEALGVVQQVRDDLPSYREFLKQNNAHRPAGEETEYTSVNTNIAAMIIEAVTEKPLAKAFSELLWQPMGAEADGLMLVNKLGEAYGSGGLSARLSDIARFGLLFFDNDTGWMSLSESYRDELKNKHRPLLSEQRVKTLNKLFDGDAPSNSRWQWDLMWEDGDMFKGGYSGQGIYLSPERELIMVWFGTADKAFRQHALLPLARQLSTSAMFK